MIEPGVQHRPDTSRAHLGYIEGMRGVAVAFVIGFHATLWAGVVGGGSSTVALLAPAVDLFFVVSGFSIVWPLLTRGRGSGRQINPLSFIRRRVVRIAPPYYVALLIALAVSAAAPILVASSARSGGLFPATFPASWQQTIGDVAGHLTFTHGFSQTYDRAIDSAFWTLSTEWQFYVLLPLLVFVARRWSVAAVVAGAAFVLVSYMAVTHVAAPGFTRTPVGYDVIPFHLIEFAGGMAAAAVTAAGRDLRRIAPLSLALLPAAAVGAAYGPFAARPLLWATGGSFLLAAIPWMPLVDRALTLPPVRWLGRVSYSAYLIHGSCFMALAIVAARARLSPEGREALLLLVGIPLALLAAQGLFALVEAPAHRYARRIPKQALPETAADAPGFALQPHAQGALALMAASPTTAADR
jgi:peptidoglycan/LPS O-acetylase OafA/YrhL